MLSSTAALVCDLRRLHRCDFTSTSPSPTKDKAHCNSRIKKNSNDDSNLFSQRTSLNPSFCLCWSLSLSLYLYFSLTLHLSVLSVGFLLHVSFCRPPGTADTFSISLLSAGQRHINAPLGFKKTLSSQLPPPPPPDLSYRLLQ